MKVRKLLALPLALLASAALAAPLPQTNPQAIRVRDYQGAMVRPLAAPGRTATVLIFIAYDCPISNSYTAKIERLRTQFAYSHIAFYVVYTDTITPLATLKAHARAHGYTPFALFDPDHTLARLVGATVTPEAVVLGPKANILYEGRIDNKYTGFGIEKDTASVNDLRHALDEITRGQTVAIPRTTAIGCYITGM